MDTDQQESSGSGGMTEIAVSYGTSRLVYWVVGAIGIVPILAVLLVLGLAMSASGALGVGTSSTAGPPSSLATQIIPPEMLALYRSERVRQQCTTLSWAIVAAIIHLESGDNRNPGISSAGARGPSQFMPTTWDSQGRLVIDVGRSYGKVPDGRGYALDGDGDSIADIMNPYDSVPATARMLCANGGGNQRTLPDAIFAYNHANWYVYGGTADNGNPFEGVLPLAARLAQDTTSLGIGLQLPGEVNGQVQIAPGANFAGQPVTPETMAFLAKVAGIYGKPIIVTTGTNHSYLTVDGKVSDHASGHAADIGMVANGGYDDSPVGDGIAAACLIAAGYPLDQAVQLAQRGGLWSIVYGGLRIQCIWRTYLGGNHHNHVHIGARPNY